VGFSLIFSRWTRQWQGHSDN